MRRKKLEQRDGNKGNTRIVISCRAYDNIKARSFFYLKLIPRLESHMKKRFFAVAAFILACAGAAVATNYSLWINGRNNANAQAGNYADFTYWGPASTAGGVN